VNTPIGLRDHLGNLRYVLRHKWFVFKACLRYGVPLHRAILHDWTKFKPSEWVPYTRNFFTYKRAVQPSDSKGYFHRPGQNLEFDLAWNHHQKRHPHHWHYWVLVTDEDDPRVRALPMPETYVREMVADWTGAGLAQGKPDVKGWYLHNRDKMVLWPETRVLVEKLLEVTP
jgi:hypothetical protein